MAGRDALVIIGRVNAPRLDRPPTVTSSNWAEVSLDALRQNFRAVRKHVGDGVSICAVVKADAYGHGASGCARALESEGARWFGVTGTEEAMALRRAGIKSRLLLMTGFWKGEEDEVLANDLTPILWEKWHVERLEAAAVTKQTGSNSSADLRSNKARERNQPRPIAPRAVGPAGKADPPRPATSDWQRPYALPGTRGSGAPSRSS